MIIGLTGGIGSGKSTVAKMLRKLGAAVIDSDQIAHQLLMPHQPSFTQVIEHFGPSILQANGLLDRTKLRIIIFNTPAERHWLEQLLHPLIKAEILKQAAGISAKTYLIVEIPLLIEANFQDSVDRILVIDCPEDCQIERIMQRDSVSREEAQNALQTQTSREQRLAKADDILQNSETLDKLKKKVEALHQYYIKLTK